MFDLREYLAPSAVGAADGFEALEEYVNPALVKVLRILGFDVPYVRGVGPHLFDRQGNRYLDCLSGYGVFACGRNHPVIRGALQQALEADLPSLIKMGGSRLSGILARELVNCAPAGLERVFFTNSGAEGIETAIKYARTFTSRSRLVHCDHAFHGLTCGALSLNGNQEFRAGFGPLLADTQSIPFNDLPALERELSRGDVAAFLVEPIQGKGVFVPDPNYLPEAQRLCRKYGTVFVLDEVQTGLGRTGKLFAAEHWGLEPDILVLAKALSGGYVPCGAVLSRKAIHDRVFSSLDRCVVHSSTFSQNDLAMAAGLATLHVLREERVVANAEARGTQLKNRLQALCSQHSMFAEIRGYGLMLGLAFQAPHTPMLKLGWNLLHKLDSSLFCQAMLIPLMRDHRVLAQVAGHHLDVIKLLPALTLEESDVTWLAEAISDVVARCHRFPGPMWEVGKGLAQNYASAGSRAA